MNELFSLEVRVPGPTPDEVRVDADMPAHGHGMLSKPTVTAVGDGNYRADGMLMHMPGDWVVFVDIERDGVSEHTEFPITLDF